MKPLAVDLCCGLGGWTEGLLSEGWDVVGFDVEEHVYGEHRYPAQLVLQNILTLTGHQFRGKVSLIVASPPCQEYSYMSMPWQRAKQIARALRGEDAFPDRYTGSRTTTELTALYDACVRIGREAECPVVIENVRGAQPWIGRARWMYGSFALWGDVPALMPTTTKAQKFNPDGTAHGVGSWFAVADSKNRGASEGVKVGGLDWNKRIPGQAFNTHAERATKNTGGSWFNVAHNTTSGHGQNPDGRKTEGHANKRDGHSHTRHLTNQAECDAVKGGGDWFGNGADCSVQRRAASGSTARKAASARIAKIPFQLAAHIARVFKP